MATLPDAERQRLAALHANTAPWLRWGPYLSERQWGTVREDYSPGGTAWDYFPHDQARSRVYRWSEDGLLGICDDHGRLCLALALWNEADPIIKERLFGLTNSEGNHGEDVKECYWYLDNTPTHSYMRALYRYPQRAFPYNDLVQQNRTRGREAPEYELIDTGVFDENRYFDVEVEYAKAAPEDLLVRLTVTNRGPDTAPLHLMPTLWFRNTWAWGRDPRRPTLRAAHGHAAGATAEGAAVVVATHADLGTFRLACSGAPELLFTENETNGQRLWNLPLKNPYVKDWINDHVVSRAPRPADAPISGTKVAARYALQIAPGTSTVVLLRLAHQLAADPFATAEELFARRRAEADRFYLAYGAAQLSDEERAVQRCALAGVLWNKQLYHYDIEEWLEGDPAQPKPPASRWEGRNHDWTHLHADDVLVMPDNWEYPWFAAWDHAFHSVLLAWLDPTLAKQHLRTLGRVTYQHPSGKVPAYEWTFDDANPPVQAWAAWRVYQIDQHLTGHADRAFLESAFYAASLGFTWWLNRKDPEGNNVFAGGFLGLDNIGVFDRSQPLPTGGALEQSDGTAWMGFFSLIMLQMAIELAQREPHYEDVALKFFEHFLRIHGAMRNIGDRGIDLWDETDGFFYDVVLLPDGSNLPLTLRSLVGLIPLIAVQSIKAEQLHALPNFLSHWRWYVSERPWLAPLLPSLGAPSPDGRYLLSLVSADRLDRLLARLLDPAEFLSPHGIRSLSKYHEAHPYELHYAGTTYTVRYEPAESRTGTFGGNSNWRGPVWFPLNYLLVEALDEHGSYHGARLQVEYPVGSGQQQPLGVIAQDLRERLSSLFLRGADGKRPCLGANPRLQTDEHWCDLLPYNEYFHGDTGEGLGARQQTGWTALVALLLRQTAAIRAGNPPHFP